MSRLFILYLCSLTLRSFALGILASIITLRIRNVAVRHAIWTVVLALMLLMPLADAFLPVQEVVLPMQAFAVIVPQVTEQFEAPALISPQVQRDWWWVPACLLPLVAALLLLRLALAYRHVWRLRRTSRLVSPGVPAVHESDAVNVPLTVGLFKPILILPSGWRGWEIWKLRAVLWHELTHVRRHDWAIAVMASFAKCVFWFNPLAWWLERQLSTLAEQASDEASVRWTGDAPRYAETLLQFASAAQHGHRWIGGVAMAQNKIGSRIERVLALRQPGRGVMSRTAWLALLLLALPALYASAAAQSSAQTEFPVLSSAEILRAVQQQLPLPDAGLIAALSQQVPEPAPSVAPQVPAPSVAPQEGPIIRNREFFYALWNQGIQNAQAGGANAQVLTPPAQGGIFRYYDGWSASARNTALDPATWNRATNPNIFEFALTGVQGKTVYFEDGKGGTFSYGCQDCSFIVWESGVAASSTSPGPGILFKLSADGKTVSATCQAAECAFGSAQTYQVFNAATVAAPVVQTAPADGNNTGMRCFSVFGAVKADGTPFTDADCPGGRAVRPVVFFSVRK